MQRKNSCCLLVGTNQNKEINSVIREGQYIAFHIMMIRREESTDEEVDADDTCVR